MKHTIKKMFLTALATAAIVGAASLAQASVANSEHNFSGQAWSGGEICLPCHAPHNNTAAAGNTPMWNHDATVAVFTPYPTGGTMDATPGQPSGISLLCLSCHDGTVALDSYGVDGVMQTGTTFIDTIGQGLIGTNLSIHHPISFTYDDTLANDDGGLHLPSTEPSGIVGSAGTINDDMLFGGVLECASCHDVHNDLDLPSGQALLVKANTASALCLTCHDK